MIETTFRAFDKKFQKMYHILTDLHALISGEITRVKWCTSEVDSGWLDDFILMQYIGQKDKNKIDIYEGDILKGKDGKINIVIWSNKLNGYILGTWLKKGKQKDLDIETLEEIIVECSYFISNEDEIIGNIYENPELLEIK